MELLLASDPAYVAERFRELAVASRRSQGQMQPAPAPRDPDAVLGPSPDRAGCDPDAGWSAHPPPDPDPDLDPPAVPVLPRSALDKRVLVLRDALLHLHPNAADLLKDAATRDVEPARSSMDGMSSPVPLRELPVAMQLPLQLFFRLCAPLCEQAAMRAARLPMLLKLAAKLPAMVAALSSCALSPGIASSDDSSADPPVGSVFEVMLKLLGMLLGGPGADGSESASLSDRDRAVVLTAYLALGLKYGRLREICCGIHWLQQWPLLLDAAQYALLTPMLRELDQVQPDIATTPLVEEEQAIGYLVSFGKGDHGKLGHGQCSHAACADGNCTENKLVPTLLASMRDVPCVQIDSLSTHSVAITTKGEVLAWGNGDKFRLGHGSTNKEYAPRMIDALGIKGRVRHVACGLGHTLALLVSGEMFAWGNGANGRLGTGDSNDRASPTRIALPICVPHAAGREFTTTKPSGEPPHACAVLRNIYCGASHSLAVSVDGIAYAWGKNNQGQCGHGHTNDQMVVAPVKYFTETIDESIVQASGGWEHSLFCSASGRAYSCGGGYKDSRRTAIPPVLGHRDGERRLKPALLQTLVDSGDDIVRVACGWDHSMAVSAQGQLFTWGAGTNGKLGHGDDEDCDVPTLVRALANAVVKDVKAGCEHTLVLTEAHEVLTFGQGDSGRLGHGDTTSRNVPTVVEAFAQSRFKPVAIAAGDKYNLVLVEVDAVAGQDATQDQRLHKDKTTSSDRRSRYGQSRGCHGSGLRRRRLAALREERQRSLLGADVYAQVVDTQSLLVAQPMDSVVVENVMDLAAIVLFHLDRMATAYAKALSNGQHGAAMFTQAQPPNAAVPDMPVLLAYGVDASIDGLQRLSAVLDAAVCDLARPSDRPDQDRMQMLRLVLASLRLLAANLAFVSMTMVGPHDWRALKTLATTLAEATPDELAKQWAMDTISTQTQAILQAISFEAARVLSTGLFLFFPQRPNRLELLRQLMAPRLAMTHVSALLAVLSDRYCEEFVAADVIRECLEASASNSIADNTTTQAQDSVLLTLLGGLLGQVAQDALQRQPHGSAVVSDQSAAQHVDCVLHVLQALQAHCVALCASERYQVQDHGNSDIDDAVDLIGQIEPSTEGSMQHQLLLFVEMLCAQALPVLETMRDRSDVSRLSGTFLPRLLPSMLLSLSALFGDDHDAIALDAIARLVPTLHPLLLALDRVMAKVEAEDAGDDVKQADQSGENGERWLGDLCEICAALCGRLSGMVLLYASREAIGVQDVIARVTTGTLCGASRGGQSAIPIDSILSWSTCMGMQAIGAVDQTAGTMDMQAKRMQSALEECLQDVRQLDHVLQQLGLAEAYEHDQDPRVREIRRIAAVVLVWHKEATSAVMADQEQDIVFQAVAPGSPVRRNLLTLAMEEISRYVDPQPDQELKAAGVSSVPPHVLDNARLLLHMPPLHIVIANAATFGHMQTTWSCEMLRFLVQPHDLHVTSKMIKHWEASILLFQQALRVFFTGLRDATATRTKRALLNELAVATIGNAQCRRAPLSIRALLRGPMAMTVNALMESFCACVVQRASSLLAHPSCGTNTTTDAPMAMFQFWQWLLSSAGCPPHLAMQWIAASDVVSVLSAVLLRSDGNMAWRSTTLAMEDQGDANMLPWSSSLLRLPTRLQSVQQLLCAPTHREVLDRMAWRTWIAVTRCAAQCRFSRCDCADPTGALQTRAESTVAAIVACLGQLIALLKTALLLYGQAVLPNAAALAVDAAPLLFVVGDPVAVSTSKSSLLTPVARPLAALSSLPASPTSRSSASAFVLSFWIHLAAPSSARKDNGTANDMDRASSSQVLTLLAFGHVPPDDKPRDTASPADAISCPSQDQDDDERAWLGRVFFRMSTATTATLGVLVRDEAAEANAALNVSYLTTRIPTEQWTHVAILCVPGEPIAAFVDGKVVAWTSSRAPTLPSGAITGDQASIWSELRCGGTRRDPTDQSDAAATMPSAGDAALPGSGSRGWGIDMTVLLDDVWLSATDKLILTPAEIALVNEQGPLLHQLKTQHIQQQRCTDALLLLCELLDADGDGPGKPSLDLHRYVSLLLELTAMRGAALATRLAAVEVLQRVLPSSLSPDIAVLDALADQVADRWMLSTKTKSASPWRDAQTLWRSVHGSGAAQISPLDPAASASTTAAALSCRHAVLQLLSDGVASTSPSAWTPDEVLGDSVLDAAMVHTLQVLLAEPTWGVVSHAWTSRFTSEDLITDRLRMIVGPIVALGGYGEVLVNRQKRAVASARPQLARRELRVLKLDRSDASVLRVSDLQSMPWISMAMRMLLTRASILTCGWSEVKADDSNADADAIQRQDEAMALYAHLQTLLWRFLAVHLRDVASLAPGHAPLSFQEPPIREALVFLVACRIPQLVADRLGPHATTLSALQVVCSVQQVLVASPPTAACEIVALQHAMWAHCRRQRTLPPYAAAAAWTYWRQRSTATATNAESPLAFALTGGIEQQGALIRALQRFPSVRVQHVAIAANTGLWFFEVELQTDGLMQLGVVDGNFSADPLAGIGVGDLTNSWAFDGFRCKKWNVVPVAYGKRWHRGDVVGVLLDTDRLELSFLLNGAFLGVAFTNMPLTPSSEIAPAASLNAEQALRFNIGQWAPIQERTSDANDDGAAKREIDAMACFRFPPVLASAADRLRLKPVAAAIVRPSASVREQADAIKLQTQEAGTELATTIEFHSAGEEATSSSEMLLDGSGSTTTATATAASSIREAMLVEMAALGLPRDWAQGGHDTVRATSELILPHLQQAEAAAASASSRSADVDTAESRTASIWQFEEDQATSNVAIVRMPLTDTTSPTMQLKRNPLLDQSAQAEDAASVRTESAVLATSMPLLYADHAPMPLLACLLARESTGHRNDDKTKSTTSDTPAEYALVPDDEDSMPACLLLDTAVAVGYAREIAASVAFASAAAASSSMDSTPKNQADDADPAVAAKDADRACCELLTALIAERASTLGELLRTLLQLTLSPSKIDATRRFCSPLTLQDTMLRVLLLDQQVKGADAYAAVGRGVLRQTLEQEARHQIDCLAISDSSISNQTTAGWQAPWTLWLLTLLVRAAQVMPPATIVRGLLDDLAMAATQECSHRSTTVRCVLLGVLNCVLSTANSPHAAAAWWWPSGISMKDVAEVFAVTWRAEQPWRLTPSPLAALCWDVLCAAAPEPDRDAKCAASSRSIDTGGETSEGTKSTTMPRLQAHVDSLAPTQAVIAWSVLDHDGALDSPSRSDDNEAPSAASTTAAIASQFLVSLTLQAMPLPCSDAPLDLDPPVRSIGTFSLHGSHLLRSLAPDSRYIVRFALMPTTHTDEAPDAPHDASHEALQLELHTPCAPRFALDPHAAGVSLVVSRDRLSVRNRANKKWSTVRGAVGFREGMHSWSVRIEQCVSKNIFLGICTRRAALDNYVGSDGEGFGFLANKAIWHNKSKLHAYGEIFKQGDVVQVILDCDAQTLAYRRNGEALGIAATHLAPTHRDGEPGCEMTDATSATWFPAISLYNKDDHVKLLPPRPHEYSAFTAAATEARSQYCSVWQLVQDARRFFTAIAPESVKIEEAHGPLDKRQRERFEMWQQWRADRLRWRETDDLKIIAIHADTQQVQQTFGVAVDDIVRTSQGGAWRVLGMQGHMLWYETAENTCPGDEMEPRQAPNARMIAAWSRAACREVVSAADATIDKASAFAHDEAAAAIEQTLDAAAISSTPEAFAAIQQAWASSGLDRALIELIEAIAQQRHAATPQHLRMVDLAASLANDCIIEKIQARWPRRHGQVDQIEMPHILARMCVLFELNRIAIALARVLLSSIDPCCDGVPCAWQAARHREEAELLDAAAVLAMNRACLPTLVWPQHGTSRLDRAACLAQLQQLLFAGQTQQLMRESLARTAIPAALPASTSELGQDADPDLPPRITIQWPMHAARPFWQASPTASTPPGMSSRQRSSPYVVTTASREHSLFGQFSRQIARLSPQELTRASAMALAASSTSSSSTSSDVLPMLPMFQLEIVRPASASTSTAASTANGEDAGDDPTGIALDGDPSALGQAMRYLQFLERMAEEVQSPVFPLLVPSLAAGQDQALGQDRTSLVLNAALFAPHAMASAEVESPQVSRWFFHLGQLLGITWRSKALLPLHSVAPSFWTALLHPTLAEDDDDAAARSMAMRAVHDGLCTIIPTECLQLCSGDSLRQRLSTDNVLLVEMLQRRAIFDAGVPHHAALWDVLRQFSSLERQLFMQFLGSNTMARESPHAVGIVIDPILQWKQRMQSSPDQCQYSLEQLTFEIADALDDAQDQPDGCFPVVSVVSETHIRLHLPAYSSTAVLHKKLVLAMTNLSTL